MHDMAEKKNITAKQVFELVRAQGFRCALSGRELTPETASLDHIVPLAQGGEHSMNNVWCVDHRINLAKGTLSVDEFVAMCRDVVSHQEALAVAGGQDNAASCPRPAVPSPRQLF